MPPTNTGSGTQNNNAGSGTQNNYHGGLGIRTSTWDLEICSSILAMVHRGLRLLEMQWQE
ncbi:hypothetical protein V5O48_015246 [Marasmius crinis-equi]|uniref:Uncharacterized protein n=1 Tax=Marasmius crinis-equi TaxID=585013 RepID=A0ABR3EV22_9AGAR